MTKEKVNCILTILKIVIIYNLFALLLGILLFFVFSATSFVVQLMSLVVGILLLPILMWQEKKESFGLWDFSGKLNWKITAGSVLIGMLLYVIAILCGNLLYHPIQHEDFNTTNYILHFLCYVFAAAFVEELLFRKMIITYMERRAFSELSIVFVSSTLFYLNHVNILLLDFHRIDTFIDGIVLYFLYVKTRDIRYCMIAHATINLLAVIYPVWIV